MEDGAKLQIEKGQEIVIKLYSKNTNANSFLYQYAASNNLLTEDIIECDFILLPFPYEYVYDYSDVELERKGLQIEYKKTLVNIANDLDQLSQHHNKPLIVTFFRDPSSDLPFKNAIVFRTSAFKSKVDIKRTHGLPAFLEELSVDVGFFAREKQKKPVVSFRGQSAPLQLPLSIYLRIWIKRVLGWLYFPSRLKTWYSEGYLIRRKAINSILKKGESFVKDFLVNPVRDEYVSTSNYFDSFLAADYFICASGHGNYSFRLYEAMRAGRIPVYVDTDCLLPCSEVIDWKKLVVWVNKKDASNVADIILEFHNNISPEKFLELQKEIRLTWETYFTFNGFSNYIFSHVLPGLMEN